MEDFHFREKMTHLDHERIPERVIYELFNHVLEEPPEDLEGEEGFVIKELLVKHLPDNHSNYFYNICGPAPMMEPF